LKECLHVDAFNAKSEDSIYYTFCFIRSEFNIYILASLGEARVIVAGGQGALVGKARVIVAGG
jgi:hypothetical protein